MSNFNIKVEGLDNLIYKLGKATAQNTLEQPLYKGGLLLKVWSQKNRLSGPRPNILGVVTGRLRSSISVSRSIKKDEYKILIGTNVEYARKHELGIGIRARPFLRPSIENQENVNKVVELINKSISKELAK
jgi:phage gpG-like protein